MLNSYSSENRRWRKAIRLKDLLSDDGSVEAARKAAEGFAKRLKHLPEYEHDSELEQIVSEFEDIADPANDPATLDGSLCDYFNDVLNSLYDWADAERVWIGGTRKTGLDPVGFDVGAAQDELDNERRS